jgi:hypothetical protein
MSGCKNIFFFLCITFFSNYSYAAYFKPTHFNPINIGDMNKYWDAKRAVEKQRVHFWEEIKTFLKNSDHQIRAYMSVMNDLFRIVINEKTPENSQFFSIFQNNAGGVAVEYDNRPVFFAYVLLEDMILSSELFKKLENPYFNFQADTFGAYVKDIFPGLLNKLLGFCEIMIFLKNIDAILVDKKLDNKKIDINILDKANREQKWLTVFDHQLGIAKESESLKSVKTFWTRLNTNSWTTVVYSLIEDFCVNSPFFKYLEK